MKILIVDDDRINSTILQRLLSRDGHAIVSASNGRDGVALYEQERPDLVLMDIRMPLMNGYEAARLIKESSVGQFIPIIFLTAVTDDEGLAKCIEAGGDDFLTKPFNRVILQAKIGAMERIRQLHSVTRQQKELLEIHQENIKQELEVGQHLFANIVRAGNLLDAPCLNHWTAPMSLFNGDLLMASYNPAGGLHIMLGDFTGHGLSAAVGALPLSEIFYGLTAQGFSIGDLVEEMNAKTLKVMPRRLFCAAALIEVHYRQKSLAVWNGGLPDIMIVDGSGKLIRRITSSHLPLGVMPLSREDRKVEIIELQDDFRIFLHSDGLIEAVNIDEELFGQDRMERRMDGQTPPDKIFKAILEDVEIFRGKANQSDDISLLEIVCAKAGDESANVRGPDSLKKIPPAAWNEVFTFSAEILKAVDPLPMVINTLMTVQSPVGHRERIYTILAELFSNALDHGILQLDTRTKQTPEGFIRYYTEREERLAALKEGVITIHLDHYPRENGGELHIQVVDSGSGFEMATIHSSLEGNIGHGGRGIALVRSLCKELSYAGTGNIAKAVYCWDLS